MRQDMQKLVGDTRRPGGSGKFPKHRRIHSRDAEALPTREAMRRPHQQGWSKYNHAYRWTPIRRWLAAQVGRPWSKVLSEFCATFRADTSAGRDARSTLESIVEVRVRMREDGVPMHIQAWGRGQPLSEVFGLYVNSLTGLLCKRESIARKAVRQRNAELRAQTLLDTRRELGDNKLLVKHHDIWFVVELASIPIVKGAWNDQDIPCRRDEDVVVDALTREDLTHPYNGFRPSGWARKTLERLYGSAYVYAKSAKQANHQELKRAGVI